jgi:hypothetical protein
MSDPKPTPVAEPTPQETPPEPNLEAVSLQGTYRIGFSPPVAGSLAAGEIYIQVPVDGAAPVMFVGGLEGTVVQMGATAPAGTAARTSTPPSGTRTEDPKTDDKRK